MTVCQEYKTDFQPIKLQSNLKGQHNTICCWLSEIWSTKIPVPCLSWGKRNSFWIYHNPSNQQAQSARICLPPVCVAIQISSCTTHHSNKLGLSAETNKIIFFIMKIPKTISVSFTEMRYSNVGLPCWWEPKSTNLIQITLEHMLILQSNQYLFGRRYLIATKTYSSLLKWYLTWHKSYQE